MPGCDYRLSQITPDRPLSAVSSSSTTDLAASAVAVVVVGTVALDLLHFWDASRSVPTGVQIDLGGVCKHVACVLGALDQPVQFITTQFSGELSQSLAAVLNTAQVHWQPIPLLAPFSLFEAHIDSRDEVFAESFVEGDSLATLTPAILRQQTSIRQARWIVTCSNLSVASMQALAGIAAVDRRPFWLLTSSDLEVPRLRQLLDAPDAPIDLLSLNRAELSLLVNRTLDTLPEAAAAALELTAAVGACLLTLGERGALLAERGGAVHYQPVLPISGRSPVGGGDVLFASLLAGRLRAYPWPEALHFAAICTRRYLLRDKNSPTPYAVLHDFSADSALLPDFPPVEKITLPHGH